MAGIACGRGYDHHAPNKETWREEHMTEVTDRESEQLRDLLAQAADQAAQKKVMPVVKMIAAQQLVIMELMQMLTDSGTLRAEDIAAHMRHLMEHTDSKDMAARALFDQVRSRFATQ
ncbi:hypothetical protein NO222_07785 [Gluconacetobacter entanii]|nr:hypothetical protein [Gluconacetobacter entanii]